MKGSEGLDMFTRQMIGVYRATPSGYHEVVRLARKVACWPRDWSELHAHLKPEGVACLVAYRDQGMAGFAVTRRMSASRVEVESVAVDPIQRRHGVGRALVGRVLDDARRDGRSLIVVSVRESDAGSLAFLRACGFEGLGVRLGHYTDTGEDAYRLARVVPRGGECAGR